MKSIKIILLFIISSFIPLYANINVIAAENFYGNVAKTIGGQYVSVSSIISNPDSDPHLFSTSPKTMMALTKAQVVIYNGADYDPWMEQMLNSQSSNNKLSIINVADLMQIKKGANPHIWYKPETFPTLAKKLMTTFSQIDPKHKATFEKNYQEFIKNYQIIFKLIAEIKPITQNMPVTATEPVFGYMADALAMDMKGKAVQWRVMNGTEPSPQMMAKYHDLFNDKKVKILFYNSQVEEPATENVKQLAEKNQIAIIGVTETMPEHVNVIQWMTSTLAQIKTVITHESNNTTNKQ